MLHQPAPDQGEDLNTDIDSDKILQGFAHFETLDMQMTRVEKVVYP